MKRLAGVGAAFASAVLVLAACGGSSGPELAVDAGGETGSTPPTILVAAASDLRVAFEELGAAFTEKTGTDVVFTFGSSGQLAEQIENGAPFDVFASANVGFVDDVLATGRGDAETKATYAFGRIVIWSKRIEYPDLAALAADETVQNLAIANPEHAPYGLAAKEALESVGVYAEVEPRLVYGENISDTLRLAESGNADAAIVALSLAIVTDGKWSLIPEGLHEPLEQALVVTAESPAQVRPAREFADFVSSPQGREVMRRYGFVLPGEELPDEFAADSR